MKNFIKGVIAALMILCVAPTAFAQSVGSVSGVILDAGNNSGIPGAVIEFRLNGTTDVKYYTSGQEGQFTVNGVKCGE